MSTSSSDRMTAIIQLMATGGSAMRAACLVTAICVSAVSLCAAGEVAAAIRRTEIPAQGLGPALQTLARERDFQIVYRTELVSNVRTAGASGDLTTDEALHNLLRNTGLTFQRLDDNTVTIVSESSGGGETGALAPTRDELEEIVVTGSHIRGVEVSASPVLRFDRRDLDRSGYSTVAQFIESLPQNSGAGASEDTVGTDSAVGNNAYGSAVNLRALGPGASLVLVNGRRLAPGGNGGRFVDISMIPLSAIERVEVLTDGASAIYGSDAVAGVVNFVLRKDYDGAETGVRYGSVTDGGLRELQAAQSLGMTWNAGGGLLAYEYNHRDALDARDREFASGSDTPRTLLPEQRRHSIYATAHHDLGDRWSVFTDVLYSRRDTDNVLSYLSLVNHEEAASDQIAATLGTDVALAGSWKAQATASYSRYTFDASLLRVPTETGIGELTPSRVDNDVWSFDAHADGSVFTLPGGDVRLALGMSHRRENVQPAISDGELPERHVNAAFGELFVPLVGTANSMPGIDALELTLAARYERYSDFGSDVTPKIGLRWQPASRLSVRGTYGESFKAPTLTDLAPGTESLLAFFASDFGLDIAGDPLVLLRSQAARPRLHEEQSKSWTAGFDVLPREGEASLSLTYFQIEFEGRIDTPLSGGFDAFFASPEVFGSFMVLNPGAQFVTERLAAATSFADLTGGAFAPDQVGIWADVAVTNISAERERGIDLLVRYPFETRAGRFEAWLNGTHLLEFETKVAPRAPARDVLNTLNEPIDLQVRGGLSWNLDRLTASLTANYQDSYGAAGQQRIASWTTLDAQLRYEFDAAGAAGPLSGVQIALSVENLFDKDPPFVASQGSPIAHSGYDSVNATPLGRFIALDVRKAW
jgi:iron complex outermembrane recepter protein